MENFNTTNPTLRPSEGVNYYSPLPLTNQTSHEAFPNGTRLQLYRNSAWVVCETIHLTCVAVALYLLYALLHHRAIKSKRQKCCTTRHRKGGQWLENLCIIGIFAALIRFANNQVLLFTGWTSANRCSVLLNISIALYFVALHPVYLFLWVRQRIFYSNRALKHLYSKTVRCLSWLALVCFVIMTILSMILFVVDSQNSASGRVCRSSHIPIGHSQAVIAKDAYFDPHQQGVKVNTVSGLLAGGIQLSFLALFLYPIMDNKLRRMRTNHMRCGSAALITLIRRSFVLAGLCILSDVVIALLVKTIHTEFPDAIFAPLTMYDVNLMINLMCIIVTFRRWRVMLFPWFYSNICQAIMPCYGECRGFVRRGSSGKYHVNRPKQARKPALCEATTRCENTENHTTSKAQFERSRSQRRTKRERPRSPVPDVIIPMLSEADAKCQSEKWHTDSLVTDHNQNIDSEIHQYSDTVLQVPFHGYQRKRSTSLVLSSNVAPTLKRTKSYITSSLLVKSKLWIIDHKS